MKLINLLMRHSSKMLSKSPYELNIRTIVYLMMILLIHILICHTIYIPNTTYYFTAWWYNIKYNSAKFIIVKLWVQTMSRSTPEDYKDRDRHYAPKCPIYTPFSNNFFFYFFFLVEMVNLGLVYIKINLITLDHSKNWEKNMVLWL